MARVCWVLLLSCALGCASHEAAPTTIAPKLPRTGAPAPNISPAADREQEDWERDLRRTHTRWFTHPSQPGRVLVFEEGPEHGAEPPLMLVHGLGQGALDFFPILRALAAKRRVIAFDLPGFGRSDRGGNYTPQRYAELLEIFIAEHGFTQVDVLGHSMGAAIALLYASRRPAALRRLVLMDVAGILHREAYIGEQVDHLLSGMAKGERPKLSRSLTSSVRAFLATMRNLEPDLSVFTRFHMLDGAPSKAAAFALLEHNFGPALLRIRTPTLLIWGARDRVAPLRTAALLYDRLPSKLVIIDKAGHAPMADAPELVVELVEQHLTGLNEAPRWTPPTTASDRVAICRHRVGMRLTGDYKRIDVRRCTELVMTDVTVEELSIVESDARLTHVRVLNGMRVENASLTVTGGTINGPIALDVSGSQIDAAGVAFKGSEAAVRSGGATRVLFSVCPIESPLGLDVLHGERHLGRGQRL